MFSLDALTYRYQYSVTPALDGVSFTVPDGACLGLLGVNGAGKSTLVSILIGQLRAQSGDVLIGGRQPSLGRSDVSYVPQEYAFYDQLSIQQNLEYFSSLAYRLESAGRREAVERVIQQCRLSEIAHKLPTACSGGERRRLNLAVALLRIPKLLILDEPTANVDPHARADIISIVSELNRSGVTIVYTSHLLGEVQSLCDTIALLHKGSIVRFGDTRALLQKDAHIVNVEFHQALNELDGSDDRAQKIKSTFGTDVDIQHSGACLFDLDRCGLSYAELLSRCESLGLSIAQVNTKNNSLEALFLSLTREGHEHV